MTEITAETITAYLDKLMREIERSNERPNIIGTVSSVGFTELLACGYVTETGEITELGYREMGKFLLGEK